MGEHGDGGSRLWRLIEGWYYVFECTKNERTCKLESNYLEIQCLDIVIDFLNV